MIDQHLNLFESLNRNDAEYLLIGGVLVIAYGFPRFTKDIDIFIRRTEENARRCLKALKAIGMVTAELTDPKDICKQEVTIFKDYLRVDVLTQVKGLTFEEVWPRRKELIVEKVVIPALAFEDLIRSKKAAGRDEDLQDIKVLEKLPKIP